MTTINKDEFFMSKDEFLELPMSENTVEFLYSLSRGDDSFFSLVALHVQNYLKMDSTFKDIDHKLTVKKIYEYFVEQKELGGREGLNIPF